MLEIKNLTMVYPNGTVALRDVSFSVEDGEFLGEERRLVVGTVPYTVPHLTFQENDGRAVHLSSISYSYHP